MIIREASILCLGWIAFTKDEKQQCLDIIPGTGSPGQSLIDIMADCTLAAVTGPKQQQLLRYVRDICRKKHKARDDWADIDDLLYRQLTEAIKEWHPNLGLVSARQDKFFRIIRRLNDQERHGEAILVDCGKLGIAQVYWGRASWEVQWYGGLETIE